jgi:hypothetical protein
MKRTVRRWTLAAALSFVALGVVTTSDLGASPLRVPRTLTQVTAVAASGVVATSFPIDFVGAVWEGTSEVDPSVRFRHGRAWSEWRPMLEDGARAAGRVGTGLVWARGADAYQVRGVPRWGHVTAINTTTGPLVEVGRSRTSAIAGAASPCRSRADWGADESIRTNVPTYVSPQVLTLHHTATTNGADPAATMRAIYRFHAVDEGFGDIGYQYVVDGSGIVYEGRWSENSRSCIGAAGDGADFGHVEDGTDRAVVGAHVGGWNSGNIGVAVLGTFTDDPPPDPQLDGAERVLASLARRHDIDPSLTTYDFTNPANGQHKTIPTLSGHSDWVATQCPGGDLYALLPAIRQRVAALAAEPLPTTTSTAPTTTTSSTPPTVVPTTSTTARPRPVPPPAPPIQSGYWMITADGTVFAFGDAPSLGSVPMFGAVDIEPTPTGGGYWTVDAAGRVAGFGDAVVASLPPHLDRNERVTSLSSAGPDRGYWLFTTAGRVLPYGGAPFHGDLAGTPLNGPILDSIPTPSGGGYYLVASDGGIFTFGDANFLGSMGSTPLNAPVQSLVPDGDGVGYWLVASDGGIFAFDAEFFGSMGDVRLNRPVTGMVADGPAGYLMIAEDGGIFTFGTARFRGSLGNDPPRSAVTAVSTMPTH